MISPVVNLLAETFVNPAPFTAAIKSSAPVPPSVTVTAAFNASWFLTDSCIVNVSELVKVGAVKLLVIVVAPPSCLNSWKSAKAGVVSAASAAVIDSSVTLYCAYKVPVVKAVPPFAASRLKIAEW